MNATERLPVASLTDFVASLLVSAGMRPDDAWLCAEAFVLQEMRGVTTHGLRRVKSTVDQLRSGRLKAQATYERLGAKPMKEWLLYRLTRESIHAAFAPPQ